MSEFALNLDNDIKINNNLEKEQSNFLEGLFGKAINSAVDIGIRAILPDLIEDEVINIKDTILENGFKEGVKEVINSAINVGKSALGIVTGNFENTSQVQMAVEKGGILDKTSELLDYALNLANNKNLINKQTTTLIRKGKNSVISSISDNIEKTLTNQIKAVEKLEKYCENWKEAYGNKDISKMENSYKNIENYLSKTIPFESIINEARKIENMHNLIKSKGDDFNLSENELMLVEKLK